jgi:tetratricopeptide (TPR) repeat protein
MRKAISRAPHSAPPRRPAILIVTVFAVALLVRLAHLWAMRKSPFFNTLLGDAQSYDAWGRQIAGGDLIGHDVFYQAPLYAYFLGAIYTVRASVAAVYVCQAIVGAISCVLLARAAARLFGFTAGIVAGLMLAFYAPAIFFDGLIQKSVLDVFLLSLLLALLAAVVRDATDPGRAEQAARRRWRWWSIGIVVGLLSLTRENALVFVPVVLAWIWWEVPASSHARLAMSIAVIAGVSIVLLPIGARNAIVGGEFHLTTAQSGPNFYIGNHARADGTYVPLRAGRGSPEYERSDATDLAQRAAGRPLSPGEVSTYWTRLAFDYIRSHPTDWLRLEARKFRLFWNRIEIVDTESQESYEEYSPVLRFLGRVWHFGVLAPLACLGLWITWSNRRSLWLVYAMAIVYSISVLAFYVVARYRLPLVPFLILFAAAAVTRGRLFVVTRARPALVAGVGALVAVTLWCNVPVVSADAMRAATYQNLGAALQEDGRVDEAAAAFAHALAIEPDYAPAHSGLGSVLRQQGRVAEAISHLEQAVRLQPDFEDASFNLANALADRGDWPNAIARYQEIVRHRPDAVEVQANLGIALANANRLGEAVEHFRIAATLAPASAKAHYNLGHGLLVQGSVNEAIDELTRAVQIDPADAAARDELGSAHNDLGIVLGSRGQFDEAAEEFRRALLVNPGFAEARANLQAAERPRQRTGPRPRTSR